MTSDGTTYDLNRALAELVRDVYSEEDSRAAIAKINLHVTKAMPHAEGCAVTLYRRGGHVETVGATSTDLEAADRFQNELGEGPCLQSIERDELVHVADLMTDQRWLRWGRPVAEHLGFRAILSANMLIRDREIGALNVYARSANAFTRDDLEQVPFFAAHAAAAIAAVRKAEQLREALTTRVLIGQAEGILMERFDMTADQAFAYLKRLSQHRNEKLRDLAAGIIDNRTIPDQQAVGLETTPDEG